VRLVHANHGLPPLLIVHGEHDLDYIVADVAGLQAHFTSQGVGCERWCVPGGSHFYPSGSIAVRHDGVRSTVMEAMASFLDAALPPSAAKEGADAPPNAAQR
jgi:acetyl esterase/lipase